MHPVPTPGEQTARTLVTRAFSQYVALGSIGPLDAETTEVTRGSVVGAWQQAGSPPGALRQAAELSADLARLIAEDKCPDALETEGVSRAEQIARAEQATAFLTALAAEIEAPPT